MGNNNKELIGGLEKMMPVDDLIGRDEEDLLPAIEFNWKAN